MQYPGALPRGKLWIACASLWVETQPISSIDLVHNLFPRRPQLGMILIIP